MSGEDNVVPFASSGFLYVTSRTRGSQGQQLSEQQRRQGFLGSQRNLYRDVIEPAREAARLPFTLYDARHTFVSTFMLPASASRGGLLSGSLRRRVRRGCGWRWPVAFADDLAVYTHATGQAHERALEAVGA